MFLAFLIDSRKKLTFLALKKQRDKCLLSEMMTCVNALRAYMNTMHLMNLLKESAKMRHIHKGKSVQAQLFKLGHQNMLSLQNQLLNVYVKCNELPSAFKLFDEMTVKNIVTWNTLLCGCANYGSRLESITEKGFRYFKRMLVEKVGFDWITFTSVLQMSSELDDMLIGRQTHCFIVKLGLCVDCFVNSALIDFYSKFGLVKDARLLFESCLERDLVLWNGMMSCYVSNHLPQETFLLFDLMRTKGIKGDAFTSSNLLKASILGYFEFGKQVHSLAVRVSFDADVAVTSILIDMYAKNDEIVSARKIFDNMVYKNIISWNTIIAGHGLNHEGTEAMKLMKEMLKQEFRPNELTVSCVLSSCGSSSLLNEILQIHCFAVKSDCHSFVLVANSLINTYSKCGYISTGFKIFSSFICPDLVSYSSIIRAYGYHGHPEKSIELFQKMIIDNIYPDQVSFLGVLSACSHGGLIKEGLYYFNLMTKFYQIAPSSEHYTCVIDLLGRAGLLDEAFALMTSTSCEPTSDMLGAFIGACKVYGNSKLANWAEEKIPSMEQYESVNYTLLSNLYAYNGNWVDVARVRNVMREKCDYKSAGCSWIEICGELHMFTSRDKSHPQSFEIYSLLNGLVELLVR